MIDSFVLDSMHNKPIHINGFVISVFLYKIDDKEIKKNEILYIRENITKGANWDLSHEQLMTELSNKTIEIPSIVI